MRGSSQNTSLAGEATKGESSLLDIVDGFLLGILLGILRAGDAERLGSSLQRIVDRILLRILLRILVGRSVSGNFGKSPLLDWNCLAVAKSTGMSTWSPPIV